MKQMSYVSLIIVGVLLNGLTVSAKPEPMPKAKRLTEVIKSPNDQRAYRAIQLENGIDVLLVSDPQTEKCRRTAGPITATF